jgi:hypothetical protein
MKKLSSISLYILIPSCSRKRGREMSRGKGWSLPGATERSLILRQRADARRAGTSPAPTETSVFNATWY